MRRQILLTALLFFYALGAIAQQNQPKEVSVEEQMKLFSDRLAKKIELTKGQKDSLVLAYTQFMDDVQKYRADNNAKVLTFLMKTREDKIKNLLRDEKKYDQYLLFLEDMKTQRQQQQGPPEQQHNPGQQNRMGNGRTL